MQSIIEDLNKQLSAKKETIARLESENRLLRQRIDYLLKKYFGGQKSETLNAHQLEFLFRELGKLVDSEEVIKPQKKSSFSDSPRRDPRKTRALPENLPTEEIIIEPEEVKANPDDFQCIGEERTEELDVKPQSFLKRIYIRKKYIQKNNHELPPILGELPPRLIEGSLASPGLLTHLILNKYMFHMPLYRQEQILWRLYAIQLSRKTMSDWMDHVAHWLKPLYNLIREEALEGGYLQVDETPVKYQDKEGGGCRQGYFWVFCSPGGYRFFEWHTSRAHTCLEKTLLNYKGKLHSDGFAAYPCFAKDHEGIVLLLCWAHARRKFFDAIGECPKEAAWYLLQIKHLYAIERKLREQKAGPALREAVRQSESQMILNRIEKALKIKASKHLPGLNMGKAISYALKDWEMLKGYIYCGKAEIDNNLVENAIRPTAIGKKNWLFIGGPEAGEKSAILYTILENCKHLKINVQEYLKDVLTRLPSTPLSDLKYLTPINWMKSRSKASKAA
jgi:transposase